MENTNGVVAVAPVAYPNELQAQTAFEVGWYRATAERLARQLEAAKAEVARLREVILEGVSQIESGGDVDDAIQHLSDGRDGSAAEAA